MNLRTLRYFVAVADSGSLTAAAHAIPIAQPALTRQMRDLEAELGVQLLQRLPRGIRLTPAGVTLYESAQRMLAEASRLGRRLTHAQQKDRTPVVMGVSPTLARLVLPRLFESCMDSLEGLELRAREAFTPALLDWLDRGMIDLAVLTNPEPRRALSFQPLLGEPFAMISHAHMRLGTVVTVSQLERMPLLMTSLHRGLVERQLASLGKSLQVRAEIDSVDSIVELVRKGRGATIMPVSVFHVNAPDDTLVMSEVSGIQLNRLLVLAERIDPRPSASLSLMHDLVVAEFSRLERLGMFRFATGEVGPGAMPVSSVSSTGQI